ncbi:hypothetical protein MUK42_24356 [Musa troglodytarum]|uniref:Uncharacterized protein n=1 Tax=Musa troglodytarum TaxID=320322 RepID=A0A9E7FGR0_9LILI|nr:hypothetical protein MUK42_24356 [Musa troglodytarum]
MGEVTRVIKQVGYELTMPLDMTARMPIEARRHLRKIGSSTGSPRLRRYQVYDPAEGHITNSNLSYKASALGRRMGRMGQHSGGRREGKGRGKGEGKRRRRRKKRRKEREEDSLSKQTHRCIASAKLPSQHSSSQAPNSHRSIAAAKLPSLHSSSQAPITA